MVGTEDFNFLLYSRGVDGDAARLDMVEDVFGTRLSIGSLLGVYNFFWAITAFVFHNRGRYPQRRDSGRSLTIFSLITSPRWKAAPKLDSRGLGQAGCGYLEAEIALARMPVFACRALGVVYSVGRVFEREVERALGLDTRVTWA